MEGNEESLNVVKKLLGNYASGGWKNEEQQQIESVENRLLSALSGDLSCLVCLETIQSKEAIWNCGTCFEVFHLVCIQQWSNQAIQMAQSRGEEKLWGCPKCRCNLTSHDRPSQYLCYCGQTLNPRLDPWLAPHSCGETCNRLLSNCQHRCLLLCHPGPCPPCPKLISTSCFCGKEKPTAKRCGFQGWNCNKKCHKLLKCQTHKCVLNCHQGACPICEESSVRSCLCAKHKMKKLCADGEWECGEICGKWLKCAKHKCEEKCHSGDCGECVRGGTDTCPCGKQKYSSAVCRSDLPCCGNNCGKRLQCDFHDCYAICHRGACPPCAETRLKRCRCGFKEKEMSCAKLFLCESKCKNKRQCGRHLCNRKCCDGKCGACEQICGRTLNCGKHKCASPCHLGVCYPCPEIAEVACRCGAAVTRIPCGRAKGLAPPKCRKICSLPPFCHHDKIQTHGCHFGDCPPCSRICNIEHKPCSHLCPKKCHSAVLTDINAPEFKPATPWEKPAPKIEHVQQPCPNCEVLVPVKCIGGHETAHLACFRAIPFSCEKSCGQDLKCGNHKCMQKCHKPSMPCRPCDSLCSLRRPVGCTHVCAKYCHPAKCPPCRQGIKEKCHCNINPLVILCCDWTSASESERNLMRCCGNQCPKIMQCGHRCANNCHMGKCSSPEECKKKVNVKCACGNLQIKVNCHMSATSAPPCDEKCEHLKEQKENVEQENARKRKLAAQKSIEDSQNLEHKAGKRNRKKKSLDEENEMLITEQIMEYKLQIITVFSIVALGILFYLIY